jgi:formate--tetrahydrofolate ligase
MFRPNSLNIDPRRITWPRTVDMNDRALRHIVIGIGGINGGVPREEGFVITAASEVMAIFALASGLKTWRSGSATSSSASPATASRFTLAT